MWDLSALLVIICFTVAVENTQELAQMLGAECSRGMQRMHTVQLTQRDNFDNHVG